MKISVHIEGPTRSIYVSSIRTINRSRAGIQATGAPRAFIFPASAQIITEANAREYFVAPDQVLPVAFEGRGARRIDAGVNGRTTTLVPHVSSRSRAIEPFRGGGGNGPDSGSEPTGFSDSQLAGVFTDLTVDNSGVAFGFSSPYDSTNYNYTAEFYGEMGLLSGTCQAV